MKSYQHIIVSFLCFMSLGSLKAQTPSQYLTMNVVEGTPAYYFFNQPDYTFTTTQLPNHGFLTIDEASNIPPRPNQPPNTTYLLEYIPNPNFVGIDSAVVQWCNNISTVCDYIGFTFIINANTSNTPILLDDQAFTFPNQPLEIDVLANDQGTGLTLTNIANIPLYGTATISQNQTIFYNPAPSFIGFDQFTYEACDLNGQCSTALVLIDIQDNFFLTNDFTTTLIDQPIEIDVLSNDQGLRLTLTNINTFPANGTVNITSSQTVIYTPDIGFIGTDVFSYEACDSSNQCATADVYVDVISHNSAYEINLVTETGLPVYYDFGYFFGTAGLSTIQGPEYGVLNILENVTIADPQTGQSINIINGLEYISDSSYTGFDTCLVNLVDPTSGISGIMQLIIEVLPLSGSLHIVDDYVSTHQNQQVDFNVLQNDYGIAIQATNFTIPNHGSLNVTGNGDFTYTPDNNYWGLDSFAYTACDINGNCQSAIVHINIDEFVVPTFVDHLTTTENTPLVYDLSFLGNGTISLSAPPQNGSITILNDTTLADPILINQSAYVGAGFYYQPNQGFIGQDNFVITIDLVGSAPHVIFVLVDVEPSMTLLLPDNAQTVVNTPINIYPLDNDHGIGLTISSVDTPMHGSVSFTPNNVITYTPNNNFIGTDNFLYEACDLNGLCDVQTITVFVDSVSNNFIVEYTHHTEENTPINYSEELSLWTDYFLIGGGAQHGVVDLHIDTTIVDPLSQNSHYFDLYLTYTPDSGFIGTDVFEIIAADSLNGNFIIQRHIVHVLAPNCVNDCVWPGDVNTDGIVDAKDLLNLGLSIGNQGPSRANASIDWLPQTSTNWSGTIPSIPVNLKHADTDGNGFIDPNDSIAIIQNYGLSVSPVQNISPPPSFTNLYFEMATAFPQVGQEVVIDIMVGSANNQAVNLHGLTFQFTYDALSVAANSISIEIDNNNWMSVGSNMLTLMHNDTNNHVVEIAYTRTTGSSVNGFGKIGSLKFIITDNIDGKINSLNLDLQNAIVMQNDGELLELESQPFSEPIYTNVQNLLLDNTVNIFPNPATNTMYLVAEQNIIDVSIYSLLGQEVTRFENINSPNTKLDLHHLVNGQYIIRITTQKGIIIDNIQMIE